MLPMNALLLAVVLAFSNPVIQANARTMESAFALSTDPGSEFGYSFRVPSPGRVVIDAIWSAGAVQNDPVALRLILIHPDGSEALRISGLSPLLLEYNATRSEVEQYPGRWTAKIVNDAPTERREVFGRLRITVPIESRILQRAEFTLQGNGNAQEVTARLPAAGRLVIEAEWKPETTPDDPAIVSRLTLSLIHPGMEKVYARLRGTSPLRIEQAVTEADLERGTRVIARIQNDSSLKVSGSLQIQYTPTLTP